MKKSQKSKHLRIVNKFKFLRSIFVVCSIILCIILFFSNWSNIKSFAIHKSTEVATMLPNLKEKKLEKQKQEELEAQHQKELEEQKQKEIEEQKLREQQEAEEQQRKKEQKESEEQKIATLIESLKQEKNLNESNFSFFFHNLEIGSNYFFNENTFFTAASTVKIPLNMLYCDQINSGEKTLDSTLTYKSDCYEAGDGQTAARYKTGSQVPLDFLMTQSIINSDNTATNILIENLGYTEFRHQIAKYTQRELPAEFYDSNITSAGYAFDVIKHICDAPETYQFLISNMKNSSHGEYLKKNIPNYEVAHKYGDYNRNIHDYGIIYGKNTYLIGVFTHNVPNAKTLIETISEKVVSTIET